MTDKKTNQGPRDHLILALMAAEGTPMEQPDLLYSLITAKRKAMQQQAQAGNGQDQIANELKQIDTAGLETPNPFLDPVNYIGGFGIGILKWANRPYWRYIGPYSNPSSPWITRGLGWKPPYGSNLEKAKDALQLPFEPNALIRVDVPWYKLVRGPRTVNLHPEWGRGGGSEYYRGLRWPE